MEILAANWRLAAVAALFFAGIAARRMDWAGERQGRALLGFVFNIGLPILIFGALAGVPLAREHAVLPVTAICISLAGWGAAAFVARRFGLPRTGEGAMALCAMSLNNSMIYPFAALEPRGRGILATRHVRHGARTAGVDRHYRSGLQVRRSRR